MSRREGEFDVEDYFLNTGGLNSSDSPFAVDPGQCVDMVNVDFLKKGGIQKRAGHAKLNETPNAQLRSLGLGLFDKPGASRFVVRYAGRKVQAVDATTIVTTDLTTDAATPVSDILANSTTIPVLSSMYNSSSSNVLWAVGGGVTTPFGTYSTTKVTPNGADIGGGVLSITATTGGTLPDGTYAYAVALQKDATDALSNAWADDTVTIASPNSTATIDLSALTADTTRYTNLYLYRSSAGGVAGFTAGTLVKIIDISAGIPASTTDDGSTVIATSQLVPRTGNTLLDNSVLPAAQYSGITLWKRKLVVSAGSNLYISDINKPESWPLANYLTVPSSGEITGLAIISFTSSYSAAQDELLVIFKQREVWVVSGDTFEDFQVKFIDNSGCSTQSLVVNANGYLFWPAYRGCFIWNGSGKPLFCSPDIDDKFQRTGDIDKSMFPVGWGIYAQGRNEIIWYLSSTSAGVQKYTLRLNLRLTLGNADNALGESQVDGVFNSDETGMPVYAALSYLPSSATADEVIWLGDNAGFLYSGYTSLAESGSSYDLEYTTPYINCGVPNIAKSFHKVVVWVLETSQYNLSLDFWTNYRYLDSDKSTISLPVSANNQGEGLIWDVGDWDEGFWDTFANKLKPIVFNLSSVKNNTQGDSLRLRLRQSGSTQQVIIYGWSVYYTQMGLRK